MIGTPTRVEGINGRIPLTVFEAINGNCYWCIKCCSPMSKAPHLDHDNL